MNTLTKIRFTAIAGALVIVLAGCGDADYKKARESVDSNPTNKSLSEEQKDQLAKQMVEATKKLAETEQKLKEASGK